MMRRALFSLVACVAVFASPFVASCGAFQGVSDADDASTSQNRDATLAEGSSLPDAADDGGVDGPFCSSLSNQPAYCADFDESTEDAGLAKAYYQNTPNGGTAGHQIDSTYYVSPNNELTFEVSAGADDGDNGRTSVIYVESLTISHVARFHFAARVDQVDPSVPMLLGAVGFGGTGAPAYNVALFVGGGTPQFQEVYDGNDPNVHPLAQGPAIGAWSSIDMLVDFDHTNISITIDGKVTSVTMKNPVTGPVTFTVGIAYYGNGENVVATTAHFDNIWFDGN